MNKIKALLNLIKVSTKAQIVTGLVATTFTVGVVGGIYVNSQKSANNDNNTGVIASDDKKEDTPIDDVIADTEGPVNDEIAETPVDESTSNLDTEEISNTEKENKPSNEGTSNNGGNSSNSGGSSNNGGNSSNGGGSSNNGGNSSNGGGSNNGETTTPKPEEPSKPEPPKYEDYKGFSYNMNTEGRQSGYVGGDNDYASIFSELSSKSTMKDFVGDVNKAVQALTKGAYQDKVKAKFMNKVYNGKYLITNVTFNTYKVYSIREDGMGKSSKEMYNELIPQGIENTPSGLFASVLGRHSIASDYENTYFIKMTVQFKEL